MIRVGYQRHCWWVEAAALQVVKSHRLSGGNVFDDRVWACPTRPSSRQPSSRVQTFWRVHWHFEAKRYGLRGLTEDEMPKLRQSLKMRWPTLIPLFFLISILVNGRTPYLAAFVGITSSAIVGLTTQMSGNTAKNWLLMVVLHLALMVVAFTDYDEMVKLGIFGVSAVVTLLLMQLYKNSWAHRAGCADGNP